MNTPEDILIWDVGHQAYIHKILTERKSSFHSNRQKGGISGFTRREESIFDPFGAGHSSTSISAAMGFALSAKLNDDLSRKMVAVIGDGALTGGMSFEALNHLGETKLDVLVILNDNQSSIDKNKGALAQFDSYDQYCSALGINYLGSCDGHDFEDLLPKLDAALKSAGPRLLKINTKKAKGRTPQKKEEVRGRGFQQVFSKIMVQLAEEDKRLVVISPAMLSGGDLTEFSRLFPNRCIDVGIAEQHAVTLAAGLAADGMIPVVHLYSTFAQRAYDQIIHDVALQNLPVIFAIDRAGLVGRDGSTHHGVFDTGFLNTIPNLKICAPASSKMLIRDLKEAVSHQGPSVIRFPKSALSPLLEDLEFETTANGVSCLKKTGDRVVFSYGFIAAEVQQAIKELAVSHYNLDCIKPFPKEEILSIARTTDLLFTFEENSARGGLGDTLRAILAEAGVSCVVRSKTLPDRFVDHASRQELLAELHMDSESIRQLLLSP